MLENLRPKRDNRERCKIREILASLNETDARYLQRYLDDAETWSANGLVKALGEHGIKLSVGTVLRHRAGSCSC